jgi:spermidine synthase
LQTLGQARSHEAKVRYVIGDAMEFLRDAQTEFDIVYFSGFTPEECRRGDIQMRYTRRLDRRVHQRLARWIGGEAPTWPDDATPFGPYEVEAIQRTLRPGGLFISQSYYRGVPLSRNPHYLGCMQRQLNSLGLELIRYYTFGFPWTDVALAVAYRGDRDDAHAFNELTDDKPELKTFHGRSEVAAGLVIHHLPV